MYNNKVIGIPQALSYYYFYPLWHSFFTHLGFNIKTSGWTHRHKLDAGIAIVPSEACLPLKCYFGHLLSLINDVDFIFVPRLVCLEKKPKIKLGCPKLIGLPDMTRALVPHAHILTLDIDLRKEPEIKSFVKMARRLGARTGEAQRAYHTALNEFKWYKEDRSRAASAAKNDGNNKIQIGLLGHSYLLQDNYLNFDLVKKLSDLECCVVDCHTLSTEDIETELPHIKSVSWYFEEELLGAALKFRHMDNISGLVYLVSFGCGAGSITNEIVELEILKDCTIPRLRIIIDEYTGEAGLMTRLESFVDMIRLKKEHAP